MIENLEFTKWTFVKKFSSATCRKVPGNSATVLQDELSFSPSTVKGDFTVSVVLP